MSAASNVLENYLLDHVLNYSAAPYTGPSAANLKLALFSGTAETVKTALESGTSSTSGSGNWGFYEIDTGAYARTMVSFASASGGDCSTDANCTFPTADANYDNAAGSGSTVTCIAVIDDDNNEVLFFGELDNPKEILNGDTFQVSTGNLTISLA